jgi:hypothetical protein
MENGFGCRCVAEKSPVFRLESLAKAANVASRMHVYEVCPRKDKRDVDLISDAFPIGRLWYDGPNAASNAIGYAEQWWNSRPTVGGTKS